MGNMPHPYVKEIEKVGISKLGKEEFKEIQKLAEQFRGEVGKARFGIVYFNEKAMEKFGKSYDKLTNAERVALHSATEGAQTFAAKTFKVLGYTLGGLFIGYSIYSAYLEGSKAAPLKVFYRAAAGIHRIAGMGYPPGGRGYHLPAWRGVIGLGISAYKNDVLIRCTRCTRTASPLMTFSIPTACSITTGGLRELAEEIRAKTRL
jgi:hypothetical protein